MFLVIRVKGYMINLLKPLFSDQQQVFDNIMKRVSYRRQKRWWNAYLLFYTRLDVEEDNLCNSFNELSLGKWSLHKIIQKRPCEDYWSE